VSEEDTYLPEEPLNKSKKVASEPKNDTNDYVKDKGASLTFTYQEGLVVQILPNGDI
jgi:hypothetical protein